jgi:hypothetical protein
MAVKETGNSNNYFECNSDVSNQLENILKSGNNVVVLLNKADLIVEKN